MEAQAAQAAFQSFDLRQHVEKKGMWAGLTTRTQIPNLTGATVTPCKGPDGSDQFRFALVPIRAAHTPAMLKAFDELIVNASDHAVECAAKPTQRKHSKVTFIRVVFDEATGVFQITNDGPGIPVVPHAALSAQARRPVYIPEVAFFHLLSGSNMVKDAENVKGGINGVGAKIAFIMSVSGEVTTVSYDTDGSKRLYSQTCSNRMRQINPPVVLDLKKDWGEAPGTAGRPPPTPHTSVTIRPDYFALGYGNPPAAPGGHEAWKAAYPEIYAWLLLRCAQLAAYVGPKVEVTLNGFPVPTSSAEALADLYFTSVPGSAKARQEGAVFVSQTLLRPKDLPYKKHPWTVAAVVSPAIKKFTRVTVVNGVVSAAGNHLEALREQIREAVLKRHKTLTKDKANVPDLAAITKHLLLVVVGALPGADWTGQRKDELTAPKEALDQYHFPAAWLKTLAEQICGALLSKSVGRKGKAKKPKFDKYTPAKCAQVRKAGPQADLLAAEGDSAVGLLRELLTLKVPGAPSYQTCGTFALLGVPMNAAKKVTEVPSGGGGGSVLVRKKELDNNKELSALYEILNLDYAKRYEPGPAGDAEFNTLRYRSFIFCFDADVDGSGKIAGLMLMYFYTFWPGLIRRGFVKWYMTPVIRVYPKGCDTERKRAAAGPLKEFFLEQQFEDWCAREAGGVQGAAKNFTVQYYKGLGGHEEPERPAMAAKFYENLYTFSFDEHAAKFFEVYFGEPTGPRKVELSTPLEAIPPELVEFMFRTRQVPCTAQLKYFAKPYKLDALGRQLPGALDGLTVGRRKLLDAARQRKGGECMTFQLAAYAADTKSYHHGGKSIEDALTRMCQNFPGARLLPFINGSGGFGSWVQGGKDAASPRYTKVALNRDLSNVMFPPDDDFLLPYRFVDGKRAEPMYYVPLVSCCVLDNLKAVTEGWNYNCYARRPSQVVDATWAACDPRHPRHAAAAAMLQAHRSPEEYNARLAAFRAAFPLDVALLGVEPDLRPVGKNGEMHHFGRYRFESVDDAKGAKVRVVAMPYRNWSESLRDMLSTETRDKEKKSKASEKSKLVEEVNDYSGKSAIDIEILFVPGALAAIKAKYGKLGVDPMEDFLDLHTKFPATLNVIQPVDAGQGGVMQCGADYHALVAYHLPFRMRFYRLRFERRRALLEAEIRMEEEVLRYIPKAKEVKINELPDVREAGGVLDSLGFPRVYLSGIRSPKYATVEEIRRFVIEPSSGGAGDAAGLPSSEEEEDSRPSYSYILNLRERDQLQRSVDKRRAKLAKLKEDLASVQAILAEAPFPAASVWRAELEKLVEVLKKQEIWV